MYQVYKWQFKTLEDIHKTNLFNMQNSTDRAPSVRESQ
jgi:hypothetical protein